MRKILRFLMAAAVLLAVAIAPPQVQAQQSMPGVEGPPAAPAASIEGTVKKVNPEAKTIEVSTGALGLWGKTLEVTDGTQIQAEGRRATLEDIREGAKVKASYETRVGTSFATRIDLLPMPEPKEAPGQAGPKTK
jgi:Cu/Ag efflux protein CusF